jgi:hypothetical protein
MAWEITDANQTGWVRIQEANLQGTGSTSTDLRGFNHEANRPSPVRLVQDRCEPPLSPNGKSWRKQRGQPCAMGRQGRIRQAKLATHTNSSLPGGLRLSSLGYIRISGQSLPDPMRWRGESLKTPKDHCAQ